MRKFFKYFSYTLLFMFFSIASAYGAITISMDNESKMQGSSNKGPKPLPYQITSIYNNITKANAMQVDLTASVGANSENYVIDLSVVMDTSNGFENMSAEGNLTINQNPSTTIYNSYNTLNSTNDNTIPSRIYNIDFSYQNGVAYIDMFNGKLSIDTTNIIEPITSILNILDIEMPDLGMDLSALDAEMILGMLTNFTEEKQGKEINLVIDVPVVGKLNLVCDLSYKVKELSLPTISFDETSTLDLTSSIQYPESVEITEKVEEDYVKVGNLLGAVESIVETFSGDNVGLEFGIELAGETYEGVIYADLKTPSAVACIDLLGNELKVFAQNEAIYLEYANVFAKFNYKDFNKINQMLKNNFNIEIPLDRITEMLNSVKSGDFASILSGLGVELDITNIDLSVLEKVTVKNNLTSVAVRGIGDFGVIVDENNTLKRLAYSGHDISAVLKTINFKEFGLKQNQENYIDLSMLIPTAENAISIIENDTLSGNVEIKLGSIVIPFYYEISKKAGEDIYANITGNLLGAELKVNYINKKIYINFAEQAKIVADTTTLQKEINDFLGELELDIDLSTIEAIGGLFTAFIKTEDSLFSDLIQTEDGFIITTISGINVAVSNQTNEITITSKSDTFNIFANIIGNNKTVEKVEINESDYDGFENLLYLGKAYIEAGLLNATEGAINYFKNMNLGLAVDIKYNEQTLKCNINLNFNEMSAKISMNINEKPLNLILSNNIVYFEHGNIFAKFNISDLRNVEQLLKDQFGIELPLSKVAEIFEKMSSETPLAFLAGLGLKLDLANIDLAFFDNITVDGDVTTIPFDGNEVKVTVTNKVLSNIKFVGYGVDANVDFVPFQEFTLSTQEANYLDLATLLPTIENVIDILKSNVVHGQINANIDANQFVINYCIDKTDINDIYAIFTTSVLGADFRVVYSNGNVYLDASNAFKMVANVNSLPEAIQDFLTAINVNTDTEGTANQITKAIMDVLYSESNPLLITALTQTENGLILNLYNGFTLNATNSENSLTLSASYDNVFVDISILGINEVIQRVEFNDEDYNKFDSILDLAEKFINAGLVNVVEGAYNYFKNATVGLNFTADYNGTEIVGTLNLDILNKSIKVSVNLEDIQVNVIVLDKAVFLEIGNIYAKLNVSDLPKIEELLRNNFGLDIPLGQIVSLFEETQKTEDPLSILKDMNPIDLSVIDLAFFDNITVDGDVTTIPFDGNEVKVTVTNKVLSNIKFVGYGVDANVDFVPFQEFTLSTQEANYLDLATLLPTIENVIDILKSNVVHGQINANIDANQFVINYCIDKTDINDIYAIFTTSVLGADFRVVYSNGNVYLDASNAFKMVVDVPSLPDAIQEFLTAINVNTDTEGTANQITKAIMDVLYSDTNPLLITALTQTENGLILNLYNGFTLNATNSENSLTLSASYDNVFVDISILGINELIERVEFNDNDYNKFDSILDLAEKFINAGLVNVVEGAYNYFKNGTVGLSFNAIYQGAEVVGTLNLDIFNKAIKLSVNLDDINVNVIVLNKTAYLEIGNIYAKFNVSDLVKIEELLRNNFGLDIPLGKVIELFEETKNTEDPLSILADMSPIDLSVIDLTFFDNITVDENVTTIPFDGNEVNVTISDKVLSNIKFVGYGIDANIDFVPYKEFELSTQEANYIDLIKLLPTIENTIQIIQNDYLSGSVTIDSPNMAEVITIQFKINKADLSNIYVEIFTQIQGANIKAAYLGGKVYIEFAESVKLVADFETLPETIENLLAKADIAFNISDSMDTSNVTNSILSGINPANIPVLISGLTELTDGIMISLHNGVDITLNNKTNEIYFATTDYSPAISGVIMTSESEIAIPTFDDSQYIPLDHILDLVEAFLNMAKKKDFHIAGTFDIVGTLAGINIKWNVPFDLKIKQVNGEIQAMFVMGEIPVVVGLNNDVPMIAGDTDGGDNRYLKLFIKGSDVYIYRTEDVTRMFGMAARHYEKCTKITIQTFLANAMYYIKYIIGFSDTIMNAIADSVDKAINRESPINLNNVINSLKVVNDTSFEIVLNLAELANNTDLGDLTLNIGISKDQDGESILSTLGLNVNMPLADIFELNLTTSDTKIVDYGTAVDISDFENYVNNYRYAYDAEWEASDGSWTKANEVLYTMHFEENGGNAVADITAAYGTEIKLPSFTTTQTDDSVKQITREFVGWYTTSTFDEGSEFTSLTMPKGDTTLYAKWNETVRYYRTISFVTNSSDSLSPLKALEGSNINLPALSLKEESTETSITIYSFDGWFTDAELTNAYSSDTMPSSDLTLYAKWIVADVEEANLLQLYDNGQVIYSRYILPGNTIDLSGVSKVNNTTKFYLASNYSTLYEGEFIMPEEDLVLHIRNMYTLKVYSQYGNAVDSTTSVWQGTALAVQRQSTVVDDDYSTRQITYTFNGYKINGTFGSVPGFMPNSNLEIIADWTVTTKKYFTVSFDVTWVKPQEWNDNNSIWTGKITLVNAPTPVASQLVLEGTNFDPSPYTSTAKYKYKAAGLFEASYNFKILTWNTGGPLSITNGASNDKYTPLTSVSITGNTTLYGTWGVY